MMELKKKPLFNPEGDLEDVYKRQVFTLRTVEDTLRIRRFVEDQKPKTAVLAGGGFIGLEKMCIRDR